MGFSAGWFVSNRRKAVLLVSVLIVASVLSVYAYLSSLAPQGGPRAAIVSPPLEFWMELDKAEYAHGENMIITFYLKNISNETIAITKSKIWPFDPMWTDILYTEAEGLQPLKTRDPSFFCFGHVYNEQKRNRSAS